MSFIDPVEATERELMLFSLPLKNRINAFFSAFEE
jgi:hypothetical protein